MDTFYLHNIRSIRTKHENIETVPKLYNNPSIIALTETWLTQQEEDLYNLEGYNAEFHSRNKHGGGLAIYIRKDCKYKTIKTITQRNIEILQIQLTESKTYITLIYKPPNVKPKKLFKTLNTILNKNKQHIIMGDLNINIADKNTTTNKYKQILTEKGYKLINKTSKSHYTRYNETGNHSIIDHLITNREDKLKSTKIITTDISDHNAIITNWKLHDKKKTYLKTTITKTNYTKISQEIKRIKKVRDLDELSTKLKKITNKNVTKITIKRKEDNSWINEDILKQINEKNKLYKRHKRNPENKIIETTYKNKKKETQTNIQNAKKTYVKNKLNQYQTNQKKTWNYLNKLINKNRKLKTEIDKIETKTGKSTTIQEEIANEINTYFATIGKELAEDIIKNNPNLTTTTTKRKIQTARFEKTTNNEITEIIQNLKQHKAPGHDEITNTILKQNTNTLAPILSKHINKILKHGKYPPNQKTAIIKPIHKKGEKTKPENYRPIALLTAINKIIEKTIQTRLVKHLQQHNIINKQQYGFQQQKGTTSAVIDLVNEIKKHIENNDITIAIFLDMKKAFDTISKKKLIKKLKKIGIKHTHLKLIKNYLKNRKQITKINNTASTAAEPEYGIPQGGNIPPILYIIYTNDLFELDLVGKPFAYADDTCLIYHGKTKEDIENKIERDMKLLEAWYNNNLLTVNEKKTNYMQFNKNEQELNIRLKGEKIKKTHNTKYLGITLQDNLKWDKHTNNIIQKNAKSIAILKKTTKYYPKSMHKQIYNTIFQSNITHQINIWSNTTESQIKKMQRQQNMALKLIYKMNTKTATEDIYRQTNELNIKQTITLHNLTTIHKIKNKEMKINLELTKNEEVHTHDTRTKTHIRTTNYKKGKLQLTNEAINTYNKLNSDIKELKTPAFKLKLKHLIKTNNI